MTGTVDLSAAASRPFPTAGRRPGRSSLPLVTGAVAMSLVGTSAPVSGLLADAPLLTAQAWRYSAAALGLALLARLCGRSVPRPRGREWLWLLGVTLSGTVVFNLALVHGARHAEPAVFAVAIACVPVVLVLGEVVAARRPEGRRGTVGRTLAAAVVVSAGAVLVAGFGRADAVGLLLAALVLACEAGFTLLAVPVIGRLGPWGVALYTTAIGAMLFWAGGLVIDGPTATARLHGVQLLAIGYLAVGVTVVAFLCWYFSVGRLGPGRAGLLTGIAPVAAALTGGLVGAPVPGLAVWLGIAVIVLGLVIGARPSTPLSCPPSNEEN